MKSFIKMIQEKVMWETKEKHHVHNSGFIRNRMHQMVQNKYFKNP